MTKIAITGITGKMGRAILAAAHDDPALKILGGIAYDRHHMLGVRLAALHPEFDGDAIIHASLAPMIDCDVVVDFSNPAATMAHLDIASASQTPPAFVIGTTGFSADQDAKIAAYATQFPILKSGNMSLGVNVLAALTEKLAAILDDQFDIEIYETHHKNKIDAPSGTALMLGDAAAAGRDVVLNDVADRGRDGITGKREAGKIGFAVERMGGVIGDHKVSFGSDEEIIALSHRALDRSLFAKGAVHAAKWITDQPAGLYNMHDALNLHKL